MPPDNGIDQDKPIRIVFVSRVRLFREGLARLVDRHPAIQVLAAADLRSGLLPLLTEAAPDVVLIDVAAPGALALGTEVAGQLPRIAVLGFAVEESETGVIACAEAGLSGYVPCDASADQLVAAIRHVANGRIVCSDTMAGGLFRHVGRVALGRAEPPRDGLTQRQQQIAALLDEGLSNKEIARRLSLGLSTVKNHVHNILDRLNVSRRSQAAMRLRTPTADAALPPVAYTAKVKTTRRPRA